MKKENRYRVTMSFYVYAKNDRSAVRKANRIREKMDQKKDNRPDIHTLHEAPFASLYGREIDYVKLLGEQLIKDAEREEAGIVPGRGNYAYLNEAEHCVVPEDDGEYTPDE